MTSARIARPALAAVPAILAGLGVAALGAAAPATAVQTTAIPAAAAPATAPPPGPTAQSRPNLRRAVTGTAAHRSGAHSADSSRATRLPGAAGLGRSGLAGAWSPTGSSSSAGHILAARADGAAHRLTGSVLPMLISSALVVALCGGAGWSVWRRRRGR